MSDTEVGVDPTLRAVEGRRHELEVEVRVLRDRLAQRDTALAQLNRRLLELERGDFSGASPVHARLQALRQELEVATQRVLELESLLADANTRAASAERELAAMRQTKVFRWSGPLRAAYRVIGGQR